MEEMAHKTDLRKTGEVEKAQGGYKRNIDKRLRKNTEKTKPGDNEFLRIERNNEKETPNKLDPINECPFTVLRVESVAKIVIMKQLDESVENVSRSRVAIAPKSDLGFAKNTKICFLHP